MISWESCQLSRLTAMAKQADKVRKSHYVSRFLTRPWEQERRRLHYYDFARKRFESQGSRSLFREQKGYRGKVEKALNDLIENPLASLLATASGERLEILEAQQRWSVYRSLVALILTQSVRHDDLNNVSSVAHELPGLLAKGEGYLDELAQAHARRASLYIVPVKPPEHLFYPEVGLFGVAHPSIVLPAFALPLSPQLAAVSLRGPVPRATAEQVLGDSKLMMALSVGLSVNRRVVVPVAPVGAHEEAELRTALEGYRMCAARYSERIMQGNASI